MADPFEPVNEAMASIKNKDYENATSVMDFVAGASNHAEQHAAIWQSAAEKIPESVRVDPAFGAALQSLGAAEKRIADEVGETGQIWHRKHEDEIEKLARQSPLDKAWDVGQNPLG
jgi:hypothetical protein